MNNLLPKTQKQGLVQEREILELRKENEFLRNIIRDYSNHLNNTNLARTSNSNLEKKLIEQLPNKEKPMLPLMELTPSERKLLMILLSKKGQIITRNELAFEFWGFEDNVDDNAKKNIYMTRLSAIVKNLRTKLVIENDEEVITTRWRKGYQLTKAFFDFYEIDDRLVQKDK